MTTLTVNIDDQGAEQKVRALLDNLGLNYSIHADNPSNWWEDELKVQALDKRSADLKSGRDNGVAFTEIKQRLLSK